MIFETERLIIRPLRPDDRNAFYEMMSNPNVMSPIPREVMDRSESDLNFEKHLNAELGSNTKVWSIDSKSGDQFLGITAFLINDEHDDEIGYRLREQFWGVGFGTELTKGLLDYGFHELNKELITADVNIANVRSVKILDKFFERGNDFYNPTDQCTDRRYRRKREDWI